MNPWVDAMGTRHAPVVAGARSDIRIVCLVPSITELICDLGLVNRLVGRTGFCIHPRDALRHVPKVGGTKDVDLAQVRRLAPTHVVLNIDENRRETAQALAEFVPHLIVTHPQAPEDNLALYRLIGGVFGRAIEAERLCEAMSQALVRARGLLADRPRLRALYLIWKSPWMSIAPDTYIARTLALAGLDCVPHAGARRYPEVSLDDELLARTDVVLLSSEPYRFRERDVAALRGRTDMAVKKVVLVDGEMTSWYGSRAIRGMDSLPALRDAIDAA